VLTPNPAPDRDGFSQAGEARRPDIVTVYARSMLGSGLLGSLLDRIDRILDDLEERNLAVAGSPGRRVGGIDGRHVGRNRNSEFSQPDATNGRCAVSH